MHQEAKAPGGQEDRCLEGETVRLLIAGRLPPQGLARAARHLAGCGKCRDSIVSLAGGGPRAADAHAPADGARELSARAPGEIVGGKYRLRSILGRGKYSCVWRAERVDWQAPVALKLLVPPPQESKEFFARFAREVRLVAALRSPHVVQVLDHGIDEGTRQAFIALEFLEGETLEQRLQREGRLSPSATVSLLEHVIRAVERAHSLGIIHRDLKPANIFIVRDFDRELVKVLDFGVAKSPAGQGVLTMVTAPGTVLGTPFYMSPEQLRAATDLDHHADLWAFAVIACECLTGRKPFAGQGFFEVAFSVLDAKRPVPSQLGPAPSGFDAWFARATHPERKKRFSTARQAFEALLPSCEGRAAGARRQDTPGRSADGGSRQGDRLAALAKYALFLVALCVSAALWYRVVRRTPEDGPEAQPGAAATLSVARSELAASPASTGANPRGGPAAERPSAEPGAAAPDSTQRSAPIDAVRGLPRAEPSPVPPQRPASARSEPRMPQRAPIGPTRVPPGKPRSERRAGAPPEPSSAPAEVPVGEERPVRIDLAE